MKTILSLLGLGLAAVLFFSSCMNEGSTGAATTSDQPGTAAETGAGEAGGAAAGVSAGAGINSGGH